MSVTFAPVTTGTGQWEARCYCVDSADEQPMDKFASYEDAVQWLDSYKAAPYALPGCKDDFCLGVGPALYEVQAQKNAPKVNVSNRNAADLLDVLGIRSKERDWKSDLCGTLSADAFDGHILTALAVAPVSAERPTIESQKGPHMIDCGRPEGYIQTRLEELRDVAAFAREHGLAVSWG